MIHGTGYTTHGSEVNILKKIDQPFQCIFDAAWLNEPSVASPRISLFPFIHFTSTWITCLTEKSAKHMLLSPVLTDRWQDHVTWTCECFLLRYTGGRYLATSLSRGRIFDDVWVKHLSPQDDWTLFSLSPERRSVEDIWTDFPRSDCFGSVLQWVCFQCVYLFGTSTVLASRRHQH